MGRVLSGEAIAAQVRAELRDRIAALARRGIVPGLAIVRVGDDPASVSYVCQKEKAALGLGLLSPSTPYSAVVGSGPTTSLPTRRSASALRPRARPRSPSTGRSR
jgi:hypothetical protein